jgi:acyl-ACP thioesterase
MSILIKISLYQDSTPCNYSWCNANLRIVGSKGAICLYASLWFLGTSRPIYHDTCNLNMTIVNRLIDKLKKKKKKKTCIKKDCIKKKRPLLLLQF